MDQRKCTWARICSYIGGPDLTSAVITVRLVNLVVDGLAGGRASEKKEAGLQQGLA